MQQQLRIIEEPEIVAAQQCGAHGALVRGGGERNDHGFAAARAGDDTPHEAAQQRGEEASPRAADAWKCGLVVSSTRREHTRAEQANFGKLCSWLSVYPCDDRRRAIWACLHRIALAIRRAAALRAWQTADRRFNPLLRTPVRQSRPSAISDDAICSYRVSIGHTSYHERTTVSSKRVMGCGDTRGPERVAGYTENTRYITRGALPDGTIPRALGSSAHVHVEVETRPRGTAVKEPCPFQAKWSNQAK